MRAHAFFRAEARACLKGLVLAAVCVLSLGSGARAAEEGAAPQGPVDVELPPILAPMVVGTRLESYAYITVALVPSGPDKVLGIREKVPFLRDAFLRELNKTSIVKADDPKAVDDAAVKTRLTERAKQILPAGTISELKLQQVVITPVQPET
jgi:hypothetical protein